jgi:hypothetical protein
MKHTFVYNEPGRFGGWPANNGIWIWGDEILVGFQQAYFASKADTHSVDRDKPSIKAFARSLDGGESWTIEEHATLGREKTMPGPGGIDFSHPDFALRIWHDYYHYSNDRGKTWIGPFGLTDFGMGLELTSRTDYIVNSKDECLLFLSANVPQVRAGKYQDRAFSAISRDGGLSFEFLSWITGQDEPVRSVMASTVRVSNTELVTVMRRRWDPSEEPRRELTWIDAYGSGDDGCSWDYLSRVAFTDLGRRNGNPPSMVRLSNGHLCVAYGWRAPAFGMRAKISGDNGKTWGPEIILRDDARTWDFGYPRMVQRSDGKVVTIYYYTTEQNPEQHIAATIWDPIGR